MEHHKSPTAWMLVARNIKRYACLSATGEIVCSNHRTITGMENCKKSKWAGAVLKNGEVIPITVKHLSASNGEQAALPYPTTEDGYNAAIRSDSSQTRPSA